MNVRRNRIVFETVELLKFSIIRRYSSTYVHQYSKTTAVTLQYISFFFFFDKISQVFHIY